MRMILVALCLALISGSALATEARQPEQRAAANSAEPPHNGWGLALTVGSAYKALPSHTLNSGYSFDVGFAVTYRVGRLELFGELSVGRDVITGAFEACAILAPLIDITHRVRIGPAFLGCAVVEPNGLAQMEFGALGAVQVTAIPKVLDFLALAGPLFTRPLSAPTEAVVHPAMHTSTPGAFVGIGAELHIPKS